MFHCEELVYVHMPKTAGSHIVKLLSSLFSGKVVGIHNPASDSLIASPQYFVSSIRNPWDWYLSLWTYGTQGNGAFASRLTRRDWLYPIKHSLQDPVHFRNYFSAEASKDTDSWKRAYDSSRGVNAFREWLNLLQSPQQWVLFGEGYAKSPVSQFCGFMTYRYLSLCCSDREKMMKHGEIKNVDELSRFEADHCYIDSFIRQESLEDDFCSAVSHVREFTEDERAAIYKPNKTNTSKRDYPLEQYYDKASVEIVRQREQVIINKFGYSFDA